MSTQSGVLFIVATPIGNLEDWSTRAQRTLCDVELIAAEDTRHSAKLLQHFGITTPLTALHEHNEHEKVPELIQKIKQGKSIALISDAGTPLVSDPGYILVRAAQQEAITVSPIPGPSALTAALCVAGLPTDRFVFDGFLPAKASARQARLAALSSETRTLVFYESPHRIRESLDDMVLAFGIDREVTFIRELSKIHETVRHTRLIDLSEWVHADPMQRKGEIVLVVRGTSSHGDEQATDADKVLRVLLSSLPLKQAVSLATELTGYKKNRLYNRALVLQKEK